ncbi:MAG: hypothetical protein WKF47_15165 [Geodermatophilaceae bacterium]
MTVEGRRPLLAEVQALVAPSPRCRVPRRAVSGLDSARVAMVLAVLERRAGVRLAARDVFAATVGGVRVVEPAADLALALAVASSQPRPARCRPDLRGDRRGRARRGDPAGARRGPRGSAEAAPAGLHARAGPARVRRTAGRRRLR